MRASPKPISDNASAATAITCTNGERTMLPDAGANAHLGPEDLPTTAFEPGGHLHVSGYALLRPGSRDAALAALERARATGMTTSVDPASAAPLAALGAGPIADAFFAALRFPNLFRRLFAEGAFSQAFVPVYAKTLAKEGAEAADRLAGEALSVLLLATGILCALAILAMRSDDGSDHPEPRMDEDFFPSDAAGW